MAQASFIIAAIDRTRAAFASVNQGLRSLNQNVKGLNGGLLGMGLKFAGLGTAISVVTNRARYLNENLEAMTGIPKQVVDSVDVLRSQMSILVDVVDVVILGWMKGIPDALQLSIYYFDLMTRGADEAAARLVERERKALAVLKSQPGYIKQVSEAQERLNKARKEFSEVGESDGKSIARRRGEADAMEVKARGLSDEIKQIDGIREAVELRTDADRDYNKMLKESRDLTTDVANANAQLLGQTLPLKERIEGLEAAWARLSHELYSYSDVTNPETLEGYNRLLRQQKETTSQLTKAYVEQNRQAADAARVVTSGFEDAIFAGAGLRDMIRGIGADLARYIFSQTITKSLGGFLVGGIGSLLGFGGGGPKIDVGGLAAGGPVNAGSTHLVGENGPELFTASQAGRIIPNHSLGGASGGGNTYIIDARGTDESVVARLSAALMQLAGPGVVERRALNATGEHRMRGASYA